MRPDRIRVAPDSRWLTEAEAAATFAARSKPLRCAATLEDGNLSVSAEAPTADWARILAMSNRMETLDPANRDRASSDAVILLKGRDESLRLPSPAYQAWRRDYLQPDHCGLGGGPPTDSERSAGITFVWHASRTEPIIEAYSLTADSSVLCERCGVRLATALFRNRDLEPPVKLLLCSECIDTENGRKLINVMNENAVPPPFPDKMTDEELRNFCRNFPLAPPGDDQ